MEEYITDGFVGEQDGFDDSLKEHGDSKEINDTLKELIGNEYTTIFMDDLTEVKDKRAERRHHRYRLKNKRKHYQNAIDSINPEKGISGMVNTPTKCSCFMCGNPRKWFKEETLQEKKQAESDKQEDYDIS